MSNENNIQAALDAGRALGSIQIAPDHPHGIAVIPANYSAVAIEKLMEPYLPYPRRLKATQQFADMDSFLDYVGKFRNESSVIFAKAVAEIAPTFKAVLDYHTPSGDESEELPAWCEHTATYAPSFTKEWDNWAANNRRKMSQTDFATFLEENAELVIEPPGAALLELVQDLHAKSNVTCNQLVRLQNGRTKLAYDEEIELKGGTTTKAGALEFPAELVAGIAPFDGGSAYRIKARLRYRIENKRLVFWYENINVHLVIKDAVNGIVTKIKENLGITPWMTV